MLRSLLKLPGGGGGSGGGGGKRPASTNTTTQTTTSQKKRKRKVILEDSDHNHDGKRTTAASTAASTAIGNSNSNISTGTDGNHRIPPKQKKNKKNKMIHLLADLQQKAKNNHNNTNTNQRNVAVDTAAAGGTSSVSINHDNDNQIPKNKKKKKNTKENHNNYEISSQTPHKTKKKKKERSEREGRQGGEKTRTSSTSSSAVASADSGPEINEYYGNNEKQQQQVQEWRSKEDEDDDQENNNKRGGEGSSITANGSSDAAAVAAVAAVAPAAASTATDNNINNNSNDNNNDKEEDKEEYNEDYDLCALSQVDYFSSDTADKLCPIVGKCGHSFCKQNLETWYLSRKEDPKHCRKNYINCILMCTTLRKDRELGTYKPVEQQSFDPTNLVPNYSLCQAVGIINQVKEQLKKAAKDLDQHHDDDDDATTRMTRRNQIIEQADDSFTKCPQCQEVFSTKAKTDLDVHHHNKAPIVGLCGHTFCVSCVYDIHAHYLQQTSSKTRKWFPCPTCANSDNSGENNNDGTSTTNNKKKRSNHQQFHSEQLAENIDFRAALRYWKALVRGDVVMTISGNDKDEGGGREKEKQQQQQQQASDTTTAAAAGIAEASSSTTSSSRSRVLIKKDPCSFWKLQQPTKNKPPPRRIKKEVSEEEEEEADDNNAGKEEQEQGDEEEEFADSNNFQPVAVKVEEIIEIDDSDEEEDDEDDINPMGAVGHDNGSVTAMVGVKAEVTEEDDSDNHHRVGHVNIKPEEVNEENSQQSTTVASTMESTINQSAANTSSNRNDGQEVRVKTEESEQRDVGAVKANNATGEQETTEIRVKQEEGEDYEAAGVKDEEGGSENHHSAGDEKRPVRHDGTKEEQSTSTDEEDEESMLNKKKRKTYAKVDSEDRSASENNKAKKKEINNSNGSNEPDVPQKAKSAYLLFSKHIGPQVKEENPRAPFSRIAKIIGERYKSLSREERDKWDREAQDDKQRYENEMAIYSASLSRSEDDEAGKKTKKKKKKKKEGAKNKDIPAPKKPVTLYMLFCSANRDRIKSENPEASTEEIAALVLEAYEAMDPKEMKKYDKMVAKDEKRYKKEMKKYEAAKDTGTEDGGQKADKVRKQHTTALTEDEPVKQGSGRIRSRQEEIDGQTPNEEGSKAAARGQKRKLGQVADTNTRYEEDAIVGDEGEGQTEESEHNEQVMVKKEDAVQPDFSVPEGVENVDEGQSDASQERSIEQSSANDTHNKPRARNPARVDTNRVKDSVGDTTTKKRQPESPPESQPRHVPVPTETKPAGQLDNNPPADESKSDIDKWLDAQPQKKAKQVEIEVLDDSDDEDEDDDDELEVWNDDGANKEASKPQDENVSDAKDQDVFDLTGDTDDEEEDRNMEVGEANPSSNTIVKGERMIREPHFSTTDLKPWKEDPLIRDMLWGETGIAARQSIETVDENQYYKKGRQVEPMRPASKSIKDGGEIMKPGQDTDEKLKAMARSRQLQFLCKDELAEPRMWEVWNDDEANSEKWILPDHYVKDSLLRDQAYKSMIQHSLPRNFVAIRYSFKGEWVVDTWSGKERILDDDFVRSMFHDTFLQNVQAASRPECYHLIDTWCRIFPEYRGYSHLSSIKGPVIQYPFPESSHDCKLVCSFASALHESGFRKESLALHRQGANLTSDHTQIKCLTDLVVANVDDFVLRRNHKTGQNWRDAIQFIQSRENRGKILIVRPMVATSPATRFIVIRDGKIFEPTFEKALVSNDDPSRLKSNLDVCCGGNGEFTGIMESWTMVRDPRVASSRGGNYRNESKRKASSSDSRGGNSHKRGRANSGQGMQQRHSSNDFNGRRGQQTAKKGRWQGNQNYDNHHRHNSSGVSGRPPHEEEMRNYTPPPDIGKASMGAKGKKKDPNAPKRPMTAFMLYSNANRAKVKEDNPGISFSKLGKKMVELFKGLSEEERAKWDDLNIKDKERYKKQMAEYEVREASSPPSTQQQ